jgi:probable F420-dependent oxidoreductase
MVLGDVEREAQVRKGRLLDARILDLGERASAIERQGFDAIWVGDNSHDPFLQVLRANDATDSVTLGTAVAIALARSPMTVAMSAWDLAGYTNGRFVLGLGSQVKAHIERRFSMPWNEPIGRMREYVAAIRAVWSSWADGTKLDFRGDHYQHTLMPPFFAPEPIEVPRPQIFLAGVGPAMTKVAGEAYDGFIAHPFSTERFLRQHTLPALAEGRRLRGLADLADFTVVLNPFVAVGRSEDEVAVAIEATRAQLAFYGSTPSYRAVLDAHGWGELQTDLTRLAREGRWAEQARLIDDDVLRTFALVGNPDEVVQQFDDRFGDIAGEVTFDAPYPASAETWSELAAALDRMP